MPDDVLRHVAPHELVTELHHVDELVVRHKRKLLGSYEHHGEHYDERDEQPDDVLRHAPRADVEDDLRLEML